MTNTLKFHSIGGALLLILLFCFGCKKDDVCNPTASKHIVSEITDSGLAAQYEYEPDGRIKRMVTGGGTDITVEYVSNFKSPFIYNEAIDGLKILDKSGNISGLYVFASRQYEPSGPILGPTSTRTQAISYESTSILQSFEYNSNGNLTKVITKNPINTTTDLFNWQDGNMVSSSTFFGVRTYEYYTDKVNTSGNEYFGQSFLGVSSKNPIKKEISGNLTTDYTYEFDEECYITKVTTTTTDETGKVLSTSWRQFTYE